MRRLLAFPTSTLLCALTMVACGGSPAEGTMFSASPGGGSGGGQGTGDAAATGGGPPGGGGAAAAGGSAAAGGGDTASDAGSDAPDPVPHDASADAAPEPFDAATSDADPVSPEKCALPAGLPLQGVELPQIPPAEGFAFDRNGNLVEVEYQTTVLRAIPYRGPSLTLDPAIVPGRATGIGYTPMGDLLIAETYGGSLIKVSPGGAKSTLVKGLRTAWNLRIDDLGYAYVNAMSANGGEIWRIEGATGQSTALVTGAPVAFSGFTFSPDYRTLYVNDRLTGRIQKMSIPPEGKAGPLELLTTLPATRLDEMTTDECGNIFVLEMTGEVWRVTPAGNATKVVETTGLFASLRFGSGYGGWKETALYMTRRDAKGALEVDLGVRGIRDPYLR